MAKIKNFIKEYKIDIINNLIFIATFIFIYLFLTKNTYIFGSNIDFRYQHYLIPEYFRELFYDTHNLFPDFAFNLGSGQNIYYLSYYGLFNPYILLSYFFPHIKMLDYMIFTNCIIVLITTSLFYFYLRSNKFNEKTSFITAFLLLVSGPLIFHAKRHIMFINYFPFLILGLFGIDNYFKKKKTLLLTISLILIILSSYYFSIPCLISLYLYSIYKYIKVFKSINLKQLISHTLNISRPFLISILITTILTIPTLYTLLNGRTSSKALLSLKELFTPSLTSSLFYTPYSIGLSPISLIAILYFTVKGKKENKFLSLTLLIIITFPIFNYCLNGLLYINAKALIPFSTLILILTANFLKKYLNTKINIKQILILSYLFIIPLGICLYTNNRDNLIPKKELYNKEFDTVEEYINNITKTDKDIFRINTEYLQQNSINKVTNIKEYKTTIYSSTSNQNYINTYNNILNNPLPTRNKFILEPSTNLISQIYLNEKYLITKNKLTNPDLELLNDKNNIYLYKNNNTLPLGYASNNIMNTKQFNTIAHPNNIPYLLNNIIVDNKNISNLPLSNFLEENNTYEVLSTNNIDISSKDNITTIKARDNASMKIKLNNDTKNKLIFIDFTNTYFPNQDLSITINGTTNTLTNKNWKYFNNNITFSYVLYDNNILDITLKKGTYKLKNLHINYLDYKNISNLNNNIDKLNIKKIKDNKITGNINVTKDNSYFNISIPYDKGFNIKVDKKTINYQKTATNFIAFPISKGQHNIEITYNAPFKNISMIISLIGIILLIINTIYEKKHLHN